MVEKKSEIIALLQTGLTYIQIRERVGLDDMARSTFHYHASKLHDEAGIKLYRVAKSNPNEGEDAPVQSLQTPVVPPVPPEEEGHDEPVPDLAPEKQSMGASIPEPAEQPVTKRKGKRPRKGRISPNIDAKDLNLNPVDWDKKL